MSTVTIPCLYLRRDLRFSKAAAIGTFYGVGLWGVFDNLNFVQRAVVVLFTVIAALGYGTADTCVMRHCHISLQWFQLLLCPSSDLLCTSQRTGKSVLYLRIPVFRVSWKITNI